MSFCEGYSTEHLLIIAWHTGKRHSGIEKKKKTKKTMQLKVIGPKDVMFDIQNMIYEFHGWFKISHKQRDDN